MGLDPQCFNALPNTHMYTYTHSIRHFNIDPTTDGHYAMGTLVFPTIQEIISHYQQNSLFIHDNQHVTLGQAVKKRGRVASASVKPNGE